MAYVVELLYGTWRESRFGILRDPPCIAAISDLLQCIEMSRRRDPTEAPNQAIPMLTVNSKI